MIAPSEIKAESMKCANPDARRCLWHGCRDSPCEFAGGTIRESEDEDRGGIDSLRDQRRDAFHQRSRFTRAGTGLHLKWRTPVGSGAVLRNRVVAVVVKQSRTPQVPVEAAEVRHRRVAGVQDFSAGPSCRR